MKPFDDLPFHLAYCTNIHPAETWDETFGELVKHTLRVRDRVSGGKRYAIGLRLSAKAAFELTQGSRLTAFRQWLDRENCYVFTINGFPYGQFHGTRVKEQVYRPDWTTPERLEYTARLFNILTQILPEGVEGSVSTLPGSFKEFQIDAAAEDQIFSNVWQCAARMANLAAESGKSIHLGFEPEPLGWFETSGETVRFFNRLREHPGARPEWFAIIGVNYDTCHLAIEFEEPADVIRAFADSEIRVSKIHVSSALRLNLPNADYAKLAVFEEPTYLHQVVLKNAGGIVRYRDLPDALASVDPNASAEARIHFHVPIHWKPSDAFGTTIDHAEGAIQEVCREPKLCSHFEIETYTWQVLPDEMRSADVVDQIEKEYEAVIELFRANTR